MLWSRDGTPPSPENLRQQTLDHLSEIRHEKKSRVVDYLQDQHAFAVALGRDEGFINQFRQMLGMFRDNALSSSTHQQLERALEEYYVAEMGSFYDLLFVDPDGNFFFTIKKESDYLKNIDDQMFREVALVKELSSRGSEVQFVDYQYYEPSAEPASFYVVPIFSGGEYLGNVVLQLSLNQINKMLVDRKGMGRTGEVYLVNSQRLMLTESRFFSSENSILKKRVETEAVEASLQRGEGEDVILDYRGKWVFSSFESFSHLGGGWIIIVEIDEDEVLTDHYVKWEDELFPEMVRYVGEQTPPLDHGVGSNPMERESIKVDLAEYRKAGEGEMLYTVGVATCTAFAAWLPGEFGYLSHLTPTDDSYEISAATAMMLGDSYTDLVEQVMGRLTWFDVAPAERSELQIVLFATRPEGFRRAIRKVLQHGTELSQIRVLYLPVAGSGDAVLDYASNRAWFYWQDNSGGGRTSARQAPHLGDVLKKVTGYGLTKV